MQRRRFLQILATASSGLSLSQLEAAGLEAVRWQGYALGAFGRCTLYTDQPSKARRLLQTCFREIQALERCFSLYDHHSELCQLNRKGTLRSPKAIWISLLNAADRAHQLTRGAFDPTIQPLWECYTRHFQQNPHIETAPHPKVLESARALCGWQNLSYDKQAIRLHTPGAKLSLNGIAQGFITDRVSEILKEAGYRNVLVEIGETRALGPHPHQRPWRVGIQDAHRPNAIHQLAELDNRALATSARNGTTLSPKLGIGHLINPKDGHSNTCWKSISVLAPTATEADALSTGLSFANHTELNAIRAQRPDLEIITQA